MKISFTFVFNFRNTNINKVRLNSFSISELAQYSGIKPHTIRIWEKRYHALQPNRSTGNTRHYDSLQLKRLLTISGLLDSEYKISELCAMSEEKLISLHSKMFNTTIPAPTEYFVSQLIASALTFDEAQFVHIFSHCLLRYGLKDAYLLVLYPALTRIGLMWMTNSLATANEHFISNLIRQKLFTAIDSLPPSKSNKPPWILFLPENEFHEIGLLLAYYLIRLTGQKVVYLGGNIPESSLRDAVNLIKPENILMFYVHHDLPGNVKKYLDRISGNLKVSHIYVATKLNISNPLKSNKKLHFLGSANEFDQLLSDHIV
jgi:MerR family transcriptional regulator, light-induced transcriptional regulator